MPDAWSRFWQRDAISKIEMQKPRRAQRSTQRDSFTSFHCELCEFFDCSVVKYIFEMASNN
jgi:hypothetical protein